ncbi:major capsid protein [Streptomyces sp. 549]|uniref:major capsid protein n=1 Tax=Streptomyces sp. 549 TaxID=3049076 RepID=UPI0024C2452B|nr:major capsid protein [Streptomyces sp. 549]MDK1473605.1 major capsid protein [Streptomyces sp. 549]
MPAEELFSAPSDLTLVGDDELTELEARGTQEFDRVSAIDDVDPETLQYAMRLTDDLDRLRAELSVREVRAQRNAELARTRTAEQLTALQQRVHGDTQPGTGAAPATVDPEAIAAAAARGVTAGMVALMGERRGGVDPEALARRATASLAETARHAPKPKVSERRLAVTASVDIPGVAHGGELPSLSALSDVVARKAKSMPVTTGNPNHQLVASIRNDFEHTLDDRTSPAQVNELVQYLTSPDKQQALVAGGGWCAPSETRYDFFNVACEDGMIDLPTFGVTRGGVQFPVSPSLADALGGGTAFAGFAAEFDNTSQPWLWTEADDVATVTGSPNKPCIRVPCPEFSEERLECYGYCLTAGNLTDDAYPEATQHMLQLLMSAHAHVINARLLALMLNLSTAPITISGGAVTDAAAPRIYNAVGLAAADYRARYGMCITDVLEVVLPYWVREVIRGDLAWKAGVELQAVPDSQINGYFVDRNVRPQWVNDWQVRGASQFGNATPMAAWPTTADFLIYAAGTFLHGNGMSLDLGVIRDSVLNSENDHTAAWSEECHLVARVGHESRRYTVGFNVNGSTSALLTGTVRV